MVATIHSGENEEKQKAILDAAQKRFGHYGLAKTTMQEISTDLGISKASLYYYFPDKEHLYAAVVEKEQNIFFVTVEGKIRQTDDPRKMLREYVTTRQHYFKTLFNLSRFRYEDYKGLKSFMSTIWDAFDKKERLIVRTIFETGIAQGSFHMDSPEKTAVLYLNLLRGLFQYIVKKNDLLYLEKEDFNAIVKDSNAFTEIFLRGLSNKNM
jgi:AcrR family transcriptional regulator